MEITLKITDYNPAQGFRFNWEYGHSIGAKIAKNTVIINANEAGLVSLANHLITLAQKGVLSGYHFHLDDSNGLEDSSCQLIFEKK